MKRKPDNRLCEMSLSEAYLLMILGYNVTRFDINYILYMDHSHKLFSAVKGNETVIIKDTESAISTIPVNYLIDSNWETTAPVSRADIYKIAQICTENACSILQAERMS